MKTRSVSRVTLCCAHSRSHDLAVLPRAISCFTTLITATAIFLIGTSVHGDTIVYGDFEAEDVVFNMVMEESSTDDVPLFGSPVTTANSLAFFPTSFGSTAENGGEDVTDSQLRMTISAKNNDLGISQLLFEEVGDFTLNGGGDATAMVGAVAFWAVVEVDGQPLSGPLPSGRQNLTFDSGGGQHGGVYRLPDDAGAATPWEGSLVIDVQDFLQAEGLAGRATKLELSFDNTLSTFADSQSTAFIKKKQAQQVTITAVTAPVPEPSAALLLVIFGLASLVTWKR